MATGPVVVDDELTLDHVVEVARGYEKVELSEAAVWRMEWALTHIERASSGGSIYGLSTGVGDLASQRVDPSAAAENQRALVRSHAVAAGSPLPTDVVRAMLLLKVRTLASGVTGARPVIALKLIEMLNSHVHPVVPCQGSLGASGDLALLAHLALPVIGEGEIEFDGEITETAALAPADRTGAIELQGKEALSLINGTEGMLAMGILVLRDAETLARAADVIAAMSVEAALGTDRAFAADVVGLRKHPGAMTVAGNLRQLLSGSWIVASHRDSDHLVQDAYSLRCVPQVHGAYRDAMAYVRTTLEFELASAIDNPSVLPGTGELVSAGNFHGEALGLAIDHLALTVAGLATISERRTARLVDAKLNQGLPAFLASEPGARSGFMIAHYTAASIASENKALAHPASVDSIPTSAGQEDHVSMGATAARKAMQILQNSSRVLAIEALTVARALELRAPVPPGRRTFAALRAIRSVSKPFTDDRSLSKDVAAVAELIVSGGLQEALVADGIHIA